MRKKTTQVLSVHFSSSQCRIESPQAAKKSFEKTTKLNYMGTKVTNTSYIQETNYEQNKFEKFLIYKI